MNYTKLKDSSVTLKSVYYSYATDMSVAIHGQNLKIPPLSSVSTGNLSVDPLLYIVALHRKFEISI
jgi:hypothetical protein